MKVVFSCVVSVLLLSGCFLKQEAPQNSTNQGSTPKVEGVIRLEEMRGAAALSKIEASFVPAAGGSTRVPGSGPREIFENGEWLTVRSFADSRVGTSCGAYKMAKSPADRATKLLDAGRLWFGLGFLDEVSQDSNHHYSKTLEANLASAIYAVKVEGSSGVAGFQTSLSFPEALKSVSVNEIPADEGVSFKKGGALEITWETPAIAQSESLMMLEVYSDADPTYVYFVRCLSKEAELAKDGKRHWSIDPKYPNVLPPTTAGDLYLSRVNARGAVNSVLDIETQGMQTHFTRIIIEN